MEHCPWPQCPFLFVIILKHNPMEAFSEDDHRLAFQPSGGCKAFKPSLRKLHWPTKFHLGPVVKYGSNTNPEEFLHIYLSVLYAAGANNNTLAKLLANCIKRICPHMADTPSQIFNWIMGKSLAAISSKLSGHVQETWLRMICMIWDKTGEPLKDFVQRFNECRNTIPKITNTSVIRA